MGKGTGGGFRGTTPREFVWRSGCGADVNREKGIHWGSKKYRRGKAERAKATETREKLLKAASSRGSKRGKGTSF